MQHQSVLVFVHTEPADVVEALVCGAIWDRRLIAFDLDGVPRVGEPHDFGIIDGKRRPFFYQTGGASRSGAPLGWRWADISKMANVQLQMQRFAGPRPVPSGRHRQWDAVIASVSRGGASSPTRLDPRRAQGNKS